MAIIRTLEEWQAYATWLEEAIKQQALRLKEAIAERDALGKLHNDARYR